MSRRICLLVVAVSFALAAPAATFAQSSSQAQYQGVAPETSTPVTGSGGSTGAGTTSSGGSGTTSSGTGGSTQTGGSQNGGTTSGASGNGGGGASAPQFSPPAVTPSGSSQTAPFSGGDWVWIVIALAALTGLGFLLRYALRTPTST